MDLIRREIIVAESDNSMSVERLSFPLKVVISMVAGAIGLCLFILNIAWELRSEVRDLNTKSGLQEQLSAERMTNIKEQIASIRRMQDVQNYEMQAIKLSLSEAGVKIKYPKE